jgi:murein DD-endopeptidase MepM/ murein hydrolase activator NlpD
MLTVASDSLVTKYLVKKGDTVWDIAHAAKVDTDIILAMNDINETSILHEGQYLDIPGDRRKLYRVKSGDSLWKIAYMYQVSLSQLIATNKIDNPSRLDVGEIINIPPQTSFGKTVPAQPSRSVTSLFSWPVFGKISSSFGSRRSGFHHGLDIACPLNSPIRAAQSGKVVFVGKRAIYGKTVTIRHANGTDTLYAHASKTMVSKGQQVKKGQVIALVGVTGRTTGPHLHFQVNYKGKTLNPLKYLR